MNLRSSDSERTDLRPLAVAGAGLHSGTTRGRAIVSALDGLFDHLLARRREDPESRPENAQRCLSHFLRGLLHQDPFTYRAFSKPRGYAGDAVMTDYIYGLGSLPRRP